MYFILNYCTAPELPAWISSAQWCSLSLLIKSACSDGSEALSSPGLLSLRYTKPSPYDSDSGSWRLQVLLQPWKTTELRKLRGAASFKDVSEMKLEEMWSNKTLPVGAGNQPGTLADSVGGWFHLDIRRWMLEICVCCHLTQRIQIIYFVFFFLK